MKQTMRLLLCLLGATYATEAQAQTDSLLVVSWNVENFLNPRTDTTGRHTFGRMKAKCNSISKTILLIADTEGRIPDAIALMEVGDCYVLERLLHDTPLRKLGYGIVHYDSPDRRGIDCALLYRRSSLKLLRSAPKHLYDSSGAIMPTRDILLAEFDGLDILVNHHPSKVGSGSGGRRAIAMARMRSIMDSLEAAGHRAILSAGDFNDDVWQGSGRGTIKYNGAWEKIDGFFSRGSIVVRETVFDAPCLSEPDRSFGGTKPRRAFSGPRWNGGVSDHFPVLLIIKKRPEPWFRPSGCSD